ncbi:exonuclease 1 [Biomphalaria glabrata]|nr:exonuclease 1 [Biomphalaria glabrata]
MGIQGLLPFLKKIHKPVNIAEFQGCTVAIDAYCWLHKGAFSCADKLALGEKTEQYVYYCMKYVEYMLKNNLKPILVFDGCHLKSKADVEKTRRERRELHRKKAAQFLREGKKAEAKECLQRCVDITPQMALQLMNACRDRGVDCIVAPYEADAQLAFLNLKGIAQIIVTEDSDLLLFGCDKIIFKMDFFGNGTLIEKSRLNEVLSMQSGVYTFEKFRQMCILSGCDYLASLPGIGLGKAGKVFKTARQTDLTQLLKKLPTYLKMNLTVPEDYIEGFIKAENTFLYQLVYDPLKRKLCPLNPYPPGIKAEDLDYAGQYLPDDLAFQIAIGNIDIHDHKSIAYFDPDTFQPKNAKKPTSYHELSIWNKSYRVKGASPCKPLQETMPSLHDKVQTIKVQPFKRSPRKRKQKVSVSEAPDLKTDEELLSEYCHNENEIPSPKKRKVISEVDTLPETSTQLTSEKIEERISALTSTPKKLVSPILHKDFDDDKGSSTECDEEGESLTAANIGEEVFKSNDASIENAALTPTKGRNVFARNNPTSEQPKFSLDSFAVEVKSRYFHKTSHSATTQAKKTSPLLRTQQGLKNSKSPAKNTLQQMFKASIKQQKESEGDTTLSDDKPQSSPSDGDNNFLSARDSFKSLKNISTFSQSCKSSIDADTKTTKQETRESPVFNRFQSSFSQTNNKGKPSSSSSVFSWSQSKANANLTKSGGKDVKPDIASSNDRLYMSKGVMKYCKTGSNNTGTPKLLTLSKFFQSKSNQPDPNSFSVKRNLLENQTLIEAVKSERLPLVSDLKEVSSQATLSASDDVLELKSLSYDDYLKSVVSRETSESCHQDSENICFDLLPDVTRNEPLNNTSSTEDLSSQTSSVTSTSVGSASDVIDLTQDDKIHKKTQLCEKSGLAKCRVPGLSRKKKQAKTTTKTTAKMAQQMSIKDLMCKFQYSKTSESQSNSKESTLTCNDDISDIDDLTPNNTADLLEVTKVQRKLIL